MPIGFLKWRIHKLTSHHKFQYPNGPMTWMIWREISISIDPQKCDPDHPHNFSAWLLSAHFRPSAARFHGLSGQFAMAGPPKEWLTWDLMGFIWLIQFIAFIWVNSMHYGRFIGIVNKNYKPKSISRGGTTLWELGRFHYQSGGYQ